MESSDERLYVYEGLRKLGSRLLSLSSKARDEGRHELGDELGRLASEAHELAFTMEKWLEN